MAKATDSKDLIGREGGQKWGGVLEEGSQPSPCKLGRL